MTEKNRAKNLALNVAIGYATQIGIILLQFVGRRIFVHFLSEEYLGINGLYSNILNVLSIAELGLNTVVQFYFYKPVAEDNKPMIKALSRFFSKIYCMIAVGVMVLGVALVPFLKYIINSDMPQKEFVLYYLLFLFNTVISYFAAQKIALLAAYQDNRLQKIVTLGTNLLLQILHIVVLAIWKNYTVYVVATIATTLLNVLLLNLLCSYKYPYLKGQSEVVEIERKPIIRNVFSTFIYKIGGVLLNNTDNILISVIVSTAAVGFYSNYHMVVAAIQGFIAIVTTALVSMVGNLAAESNKVELKNTFQAMLLFYHFVAAFGMISFIFLFNDLIVFWLGEGFVMDQGTVFAISLNFYLTNAISPVWMYREATGLFSKVKFLMLITAAVNATLSVIFGIHWGVCGIILATSLSRIVTAVWYEPRILYKNVFGTTTISYWLQQGKYFLFTAIAFGGAYLIARMMPTGILFMLLKAVIFLVLCAVIFLLGTWRSSEARYIKALMKRFIKHRAKE